MQMRLLPYTAAGLICLALAGKRTAQVSAPAVEKYVALTFDDSPHAGSTDHLLDSLKERWTRTTFFLVV